MPAIEGWFTIDDEPVLLGNRCTSCRTVYFPKASFFCRNPDCDGEEFEEARLSRRGKIWSYTDAQYQPPSPFIAPPGDYQPFAHAAVELAEEQMVILGQVASGFGVADLEVGQEVELIVEELYSDDEHDYLVYKWKPAGAERDGVRA
ncbi:MAG: OB-fold domain-containing protein [Frankiaceae bacterium]|nr:OB-fold domain-containing protein [Frankiaceae bacterium]MBV9871133.1 OB-fold domain-containing protein [Frankiaceae bacterium]